MDVFINGACGRMGSEVRRLLECGYRGHRYAGGADLHAAPDSCIPRSLKNVCGNADVIIDFSHHSAAETLCRYAVEQRLPLLVASTGHTSEELLFIQNASCCIPVFLAANLSLGAALLRELAIIAAPALPESDVEILEMHHNRKLDAPSGTALELAESIAKARGDGSAPLCGRSGHRQRKTEEIGIHAVRMGNLTGSHTVFFGSDEETLLITHTAHTPRVYALGAILAAEYLIRQPNGLYTMQHLLKSREASQKGVQP